MSASKKTSKPRRTSQRRRKTKVDEVALPKRAAVTGGSGFVGSHVVRQLCEAGVEVSVLVMAGDPAHLIEDLPVRIVQGDIRTGAGLDTLCDGADGLFHLAAIYALWLPRPELMYEVNVGGTRNVIAAARRAGITRMVHTSSIAAVGYLPGRTASDETTGFNDWAIADDYVLSKYISEVDALAGRGDDLAIIAVNPAFPLGAGDIGPTPTGRIVRDILRGRMPFMVPGGLNVVDVRDVATGHLLAWRKGKSGQRYILGGDNVENRQLTRIIAKEGDRKPARFTMPVAPLKVLGHAAEHVAERVTRRAPMLTGRSIAYMAGRYLWFDVGKARRELGYAPRPAQEAVAGSVAWFRS